MCRYWDGIVMLSKLLKNLIASDRDGEWEGHLQAVQDILPIFRECDSINYLRYASWYVEKMRKLPSEHQEIYNEFMEGKFVVKTKCESFNAVSPDMKLEQAIQRSKKSSGGIIGQTRQDSYISEWELVYHEVLSISNCYNSLTSAEYSSRETSRTWW